MDARLGACAFLFHISSLLKLIPFAALSEREYEYAVSAVFGLGSIDGRLDCIRDGGKMLGTYALQIGSIRCSEGLTRLGYQVLRNFRTDC